MKYVIYVREGRAYVDSEHESAVAAQERADELTDEENISDVLEFDPDQWWSYTKYPDP